MLLLTENARGFSDGLRLGEYDAVIGGARREEERSRAKERGLLFSEMNMVSGICRINVLSCGTIYNGRVNPGESIRVFPLLKLDRIGYLALHRGGEYSRRSTLFCERARSYCSRHATDSCR